MEISELVRLFRLGESDHRIQAISGYNRRTVAKYRRWAKAQGLLAGLPVEAGRLHDLLTTTLPAPQPPQQKSTVERYRDQIAALRARGVEVAAIRTRLEEQHRVPISYSAVWRMVKQLEPPKAGEVFVRVEVKPGSEAQVDFGYAGLTVDAATGQLRKTWVFVMVLSFSRHLYAELVYDQRIETWLGCHEHAFAFFGGVPERLVPDNLKAAVVRASFTNPVLQRSYTPCGAQAGNAPSTTASSSTLTRRGHHT